MDKTIENENLQQEVARLTAENQSLKSDYDALKSENEDLKGRKDMWFEESNKWQKKYTDLVDRVESVAKIVHGLATA